METPPSDVRGFARYQIPTHLNVPDRIAIPLLGVTFHVTIRQGLIFLIGGSMAFQLWGHLEGLSTLGIAGHAVRLCIAVLLAVATFVVATLQIGGRFLEAWAVLLLRYHRSPRILLWQSVAQENDVHSPHISTKNRTHYQEEEGSTWF